MKKIGVVLMGIFLLGFIPTIGMAIEVSEVIKTKRAVRECIQEVRSSSRSQGFDAYVRTDTDGKTMIHYFGTEAERFRFKKCLTLKDVF